MNRSEGCGFRKRERLDDDEDFNNNDTRNVRRSRTDGLLQATVLADGRSGTVATTQREQPGPSNNPSQAQPPLASMPLLVARLLGVSTMGSAEPSATVPALLAALRSQNISFTASQAPSSSFLDRPPPAQPAFATGSPLAAAKGSTPVPNHAASAVLQLAANPTVDVNSLLLQLALASANRTVDALQAVSIVQMQPGSPSSLSGALIQALPRNPSPGLRNDSLFQQPVSANPTTQSTVAPLAQPSPPTFRAQQLPQNAAGQSDLLLSLLTQKLQASPAPAVAGGLNLPMAAAAGRAEESSRAPVAVPEVQRLPVGGSEAKATATAASTSGVSSQLVLSSTTSDSAPTASDSESILLYIPSDENKLSPYQCLARQQLEFFVADQAYLEAGAQGRNRPIVLGQVGIRCKWCAQLSHRQKQRASTYFPTKLAGVYQTAQNITISHLMMLCQCVPAAIQKDLQALQSKKSGAGGGRKYWTQSAISLGIGEAESGGLRLQRDSEEAKEG